MLDILKIQRIQRRYTKNNKNKIYNFYIFLFIISKVFLSHFIKSSHRKIELSSSYINLKTMGSRDIKVYSDEYKGDKPDVIIINNKINLTKNEIRNTHNFENSGNNINNITLIWNNPLNSTSQMFRRCDNIIEINFSNFDASSVTDMFFMVYYCKSLISLDFSNFNTSSVKNMGGMFEYSYRLYSLNLSSFDTSSVTYMGGMFEYCESLNFLDLSSFDTSIVTTMRSMFYRCLALYSLDLSNFNTNDVVGMSWMFYQCSSLNYLDLLNFDTSKVSIENIFYKTPNIKYIILKFPDLNIGLINDIRYINDINDLAICGINMNGAKNSFRKSII